MRYTVKAYLCARLAGVWMTAEELHASLRHDYENEPHFTVRSVEEHLRSLRAVGIVCDRYTDTSGRNARHEWTTTETGEYRIRSEFPHCLN